MNAVDEAIQRPFSFGGGRIGKRSRAVGEDHALACEGSADYFAKSGRNDLAKEQRRCAAWWQRLATLSATEADQFSTDLFLKAAESLDALTAVAGKGHDEALNYLALLANGVLNTLLEFAADGHKQASDGFITSLSAAVGNFEFLATKRPELFREWSKKSDAVPGLIARSRAQSTYNDQLLETLQQGEDSLLATAVRKKRGRFWKFDGANLLAYRLIGHVQNAIGSYESDKEIARHCGKPLPDWRTKAAQLKRFSAATWPSWAQVSWQVIVEISPQKQPALHPGFHDPKTMICNVRKPPINADGKSGKASGIQTHDIKEALFGAFEQLATGESRRTKERRKAKKNR